MLVKAETPVNNLLKCELTDNQFAAFCSLCYNIGTWNFAHSSALSEANAGNLDDVPNHIALWDEVDGIPDKGLIRRQKKKRTQHISLYEPKGMFLIMNKQLVSRLDLTSAYAKILANKEPVECQQF